MKELFYTLMAVIILAVMAYSIQVKKEQIGYENDVVNQTRKASIIADTVGTFDRDQLIQLLDESEDTPTLFVPDRMEVPSDNNE